jgi:pimeloyl-ACP methyl ester carboxylesterase
MVTFDSWNDVFTLDRPGFGEAFFKARQIDAIHVSSKGNDWYQYPEMLAAMACVRAASRSYARVITYGSSMGAYAAIRLAGLAGAHCALAMSPQFSIDPKVTPFEVRWRAAIDRFQPVWENSIPFPVLDEAYVVFDPFDMDKHHIELLQAAFTFTPVPLPNAGHTVMGFLLDVELLQPLVMGVCQGAFDAQSLVQEAKRRRRQSPQYFSALAERTPLSNSVRRIALLRQAIEIAPNHAGCTRRLAVEFCRAGRFDEAIAAHKATLVIEPGQPDLMWHYSRTLEEKGDLQGAVALMEEIDVITKGSVVYRPRLTELRARLNASLPAAETLVPIVREEPEKWRKKVWRFLDLRRIGRRPPA